MKSKNLLRFALLGALLGTSLASGPVYAQKDARRTGGTAKEDRNAQTAKSGNKESRGGSGTNKSEGRGDSRARKERR